tara:strand:- start:293 stop:1588 length:1296 start_codon:yes stop_codon:yes gene_type:complete
MKIRNKKIIYLLSLLIIIFSLLVLLNIKFDYQANKIKYKDQFQNKVFPLFISLPDKLKSTLLIFTGKRSFNNLFNDYNVKFLPETEYIQLDLKKIKTSFDKSLSKTFFIEIFGDNLFLISKSGEFYKANLDEIKNDRIKKINEKIVLDNLKKDNVNFVINDVLVIDDKIFVLKASEDNPANNNCGKLEIYYSSIKDIFNFNHFKTFNECVGAGIVAGGMQKYSFNNKSGILISTVSSNPNPTIGKSQNDNSIFGKIIFVDFDTKEVIKISKGHRNPQGLAVRENIILSTEHGPKGGDEINKIIYGKNYGWPIASYGLPYPTEKNFQFEKNHEDKGFEEPVYVFLSAVGISELIFLPNSFHPDWRDNVIVSSLNGRSLFRIRFSDNNYDKVLYIEKIFIGERIRDLKYSSNQKLIVLALEDTGVLGVLNLKE